MMNMTFDSGLEFAYYVFVWIVGIVLLVESMCFWYRLYSIPKSLAVRWDYIALHAALGCLCMLGALTTWWPEARQTVTFTAIRILSVMIAGCYLSVTHRAGSEFKVPSYMVKDSPLRSRLVRERSER